MVPYHPIKMPRANQADAPFKTGAANSDQINGRDTASRAESTAKAETT